MGGAVFWHWLIVIECDMDEGIMGVGVVDEGTVDEGTVDEGTVDEGTVDEGTVDEGTVDEGTVDEGTVDEGTVDEGTVDEGTVDEGTVDEGTVDEGTVDEGTVDEGILDEGFVPRAISLPRREVCGTVQCRIPCTACALRPSRRQPPLSTELERFASPCRLTADASNLDAPEMMDGFLKPGRSVDEYNITRRANGACVQDHKVFLAEYEGLPLWMVSCSADGTRW